MLKTRRGHSYKIKSRAGEDTLGREGEAARTSLTGKRRKPYKNTWLEAEPCHAQKKSLFLTSS